MFSRMQLMAGNEAVASRFNVHHKKTLNPFVPKVEISGFDHAAHPIIIGTPKELICDDFHWGLVPPDWKKSPEAIWNHTISAKLEYIGKRYAWQKVSQNRALVPATAYFEYHWNDIKGNSKTKYIIRNTTEEIFALAGLFSVWINPKGELLQTFAVCTTNANETMRFIHNKDAAKHYHRMPVMLNRADEMNWLDTAIPYMDFGFPNYKPELAESPADDLPIQIKLF